jgi:hypothetical protein
MEIETGVVGLIIGQIVGVEATPTNLYRIR